MRFLLDILRTETTRREIVADVITLVAICAALYVLTVVGALVLG